MWLLMTESGVARSMPPLAVRAHAASDALPAPKADRAGAADSEQLGRPFALSLDGHGRARLFVHPGRLYVGEAGFDRVAAQFDLGCATVFASLDAAEAEQSDSAGFLLVLEGKFSDTAGNCYDGGVVFSRGLR